MCFVLRYVNIMRHKKTRYTRILFPKKLRGGDPRVYGTDKEYALRAAERHLYYIHSNGYRLYQVPDRN